MINFIVWLIVVGAFLGWLASRIMGTDGQQDVLIDIVVGVVGAFVAGWFISPLVGVGTINQSDFSLPALVVSLVGASSCWRSSNSSAGEECAATNDFAFPKIKRLSRQRGRLRCCSVVRNDHPLCHSELALSVQQGSCSARLTCQNNKYQKSERLTKNQKPTETNAFLHSKPPTRFGWR